jgi:hypothetical protein
VAKNRGTVAKNTVEGWVAKDRGTVAKNRGMGGKVDSETSKLSGFDSRHPSIIMKRQHKTNH